MTKQIAENTRNIYLATCLYDCIEDTDIRAIRKLLDFNGANPNVLIPRRGIAPFHLAIGKGSEETAEEITKLFLVHGGNPNVCSDERLTPVHIAAAWGRLNILKLLLNCGGDPCLQDDEGKTPLDYAKSEQLLDVIEYLQNYFLNFYQETYCEKLPYHIVLDKVILNNGSIIAEYGVSDYDNQLTRKSLTSYKNSILDSLPKDVVNSYVSNWCNSHAHISCDAYNLDKRIDNFNLSAINESSKNEGLNTDKGNNKLRTINEPNSANNTNTNSNVLKNKISNFNQSFINDVPENSSNCTQNTEEHINSNDLNREISNFNQSVINEVPEKCSNCLQNSENYKNSNDLNRKINPSAINEVSKKSGNCPLNLQQQISLEIIHSISSDDSCFKNIDTSRESGILTIPSSDTSQESGTINDVLNKCIIINSSAETCTKRRSSPYYTCDSSVNSLEKNILYSVMTLDLSDNSKDKQGIDVINITSDISARSDKKSLNKDDKSIYHNQELDNSVISITEEYKYVDKEEGIVLIEKRILVNPKIDDSKSICSANTLNTAPSSKVSSLPSVLDYDTDTLRRELTVRGEPPGPITKTTKRVYLKQLKRLKKTGIVLDKSNQKQNAKVYSVELEKTIKHPNWSSDLTIYKSLETVLVDQFSNPDPTKRWREGLTKASFTYLLLDPRITDNLPGRADKLQIEDSWKTFLSAIFYVGKGKRSRPYSHLYEAVTHWNNAASSTKKTNKKIDYILSIWGDQFGVICLHIFQNVIPVEAYTREASMINALRLQNLCNSKSGDFYGISATWPEKQKRLLGVYLLYRAMLIFLNEGERQLRPDDIGK